MTDSLRIDKRGRVTIFTLNRPDKMNAIDTILAQALQDGFAAFDADDDQRVAILTGAGEKTFTAGADLADFPELWRCLPGMGITTMKPVICAVDGLCIGGGIVMAALSDLCVASTRAKFVYPEGKVGVTGGFIATLAARLPHKMAMEIMLLGRAVSADRAFQMGLVNEVTKPGQHLEAALAMAEEMAEMAPLVLRTLKQAVVAEMLTPAPAETMGRAIRDLDRVETSEDKREGLAAFREKRKAEFRGR
ncbi:MULTISPECIES: enoyl-CoA hydratase/isomerase family protein [unclassified Roseovarius]|uniref:enoyl-CoA hydratase/isomerase family protein n=1 Tax=unclassified Roseovarius TaxID=2614913 RepID=UPI00273F02B4|nr:enoyl-CoA hydratase-related protein [Roseovarius sp. MMSF_3350]